ncbi:MAG: hypothetical protein HY899_16510 [Deltaproteobacteria bacterium]|nr:hypothetical protein [Deltaproteobacteria bacterium]
MTRAAITDRPRAVTAAGVSRRTTAARGSQTAPRPGLAAAIAIAWTLASVTACTPTFTPRRAAEGRSTVRPDWPTPWSQSEAAAAHRTGTFDNGRADFVAEVQGVESAYRTTPVFVLPGESLTIRIASASAPVRAAAEAGKLRVDGPGLWTWTAPSAPGTHSCIRLTEERRLDSICVKAFVLQPYHGEANLGGFRIGHYARELRDGDEAYAMPRGFVRVSAGNVDEPVSPHFRLGQFLCKQQETYPQFLVLRTALLVKLEMLMEKLAADGVVADTLHVMSGYRTPFYNAAIGNETIYSRHAYGDAADVYVDRDADGNMDDIDGDGHSSTEDARLLYRLVDGALDAAGSERLAGGLAVYAPNRAHGPFVHVDTRGRRARW